MSSLQMETLGPQGGNQAPQKTTDCVDLGTALEPMGCSPKQYVRALVVLSQSLE